MDGTTEQHNPLAVSFKQDICVHLLFLDEWPTDLWDVFMVYSVTDFYTRSHILVLHPSIT